MKNKKIAVVGAGGKTTLIHRLAEEYRRKGASVLVTTTTHMLVESNTDLSCDSFAIREKIKRTGYCMAGSLCPGQKQKIGSLPEPVFHDLLTAADYVLIEADGAKHYSLKYPAEHEPVIPAEATDVILVLGSWDLGKSCQNVIFRFDRMAELTGISGKKTVGIAELRLLRKAYEEKLREMNFSGEFHVLLSEKTEQDFLFRTWQEAVRDCE